MSGLVLPSSQAKSRRMAKNDIEKAGNRYRRFTGHDPEDLGSVQIPSLPKVAAVIGSCDGIMYTTVRDGREEKYIHKFRVSAAPLFAVSPDGKQLLLIGGSFLFTERGIVDRTKR